jgi:bacterioferritin
MKKKGITILKGILPEEIIFLLNKAYAEEWLAYYQYFVEAKVISGIMKDNVIAELNQHAADELRHANMVADRILQLGGELILNPKEWFKKANCIYEAPNKKDVLEILKQAINGERCAIETYANIVDITAGKDILTYNIASSILSDEVEHEEDLQSLFDDIKGFIKSLKADK